MSMSAWATRPALARCRSAARFARFIAPLFLAVFLAACAAPARETFDFDGAATGSRPLPIKTAASLSVTEPAAVGPVASDRVVVRQTDQSLAVLPGVQWSTRLPGLFQRRLIDTLERAGVAAALPATTNAAYQLQTELRRFEIDVARNVAVVDVVVRLVGDASGKARAAEVFSSQSSAPEHTGAPAIRALSDAADDSARKIAQWTRARL